MAIKHIVTYGFGFADGVKFIPTLGFTPNVAIIIAGPYYFQKGQIYVAGAERGQTYSAGSEKGQVYVAGAASGKINSG